MAVACRGVRRVVRRAWSRVVEFCEYQDPGLQEYIVWNDDQYIVWNTSEYIVWG